MSISVYFRQERCVSTILTLCSALLSLFHNNVMPLFSAWFIFIHSETNWSTMIMLSPWVAMMNTSNLFPQFSNFQYYVLGYDNHPSTRTALSIKPKWYDPPSHHINLISRLTLGETKRSCSGYTFGAPST